jgi:hypothetical protein
MDGFVGELVAILEAETKQKKVQRWHICTLGQWYNLIDTVQYVTACHYQAS